MLITFSKSKEEITYLDKKISAWCKVRSIENKLRKLNEVVYTEPEKHPYSPSVFPDGTWKVTAVVAHPDKIKDSYLYPFFISTDAEQDVKIWNIRDGKYTTPSGKIYRDKFYGLHYSSSNTTLGCIRIKEKQDLLDLIAAINIAFKNKEIVDLVVEQ